MEPIRVTRTGAPGMTYAQTRNSRWYKPTRGVRIPAARTQRLRGFALALPPRAAFSHETAAQLWRLYVPEVSQIHVTHTARIRRAGVSAHLSDPGTPVLIDGLPVTDLARTWRDLGPRLALPELVAVTDQVLRRGQQLIVPDRVRGALHLRQALELADPRSLSPRESILRVAVVVRGLPTPKVNLDIHDDNGWVACADLAWPEYRLIVEYDGSHHADPRQRHQDALTRNRLADLGWSVRVVTAGRTVGNCVTMIENWLRAAGWSG